MNQVSFVDCTIFGESYSCCMAAAGLAEVGLVSAVHVQAADMYVRVQQLVVELSCAVTHGKAALLHIIYGQGA